MIKLSQTQKNYLTFGAVGVAGLYVLTRLTKEAAKDIATAARDSAEAVGETVNPADRRNAVYRAVNAVGDVFDNGSTDDSFSLGGWIYDITHRGEFDNTLPPSSQVQR